MAKENLSKVNGFQIDWQRAELTKGNITKPLEPRQMQLLKVLIEAEGNIVSHQQIADSVWQKVVVSNNTIQQNVTQLRKLLDDDGRQQKTIKTHAKLGYSLKTDKTTKASTPVSKLMLLLPLLLALLFILEFIGSNENAPILKAVAPIADQNELIQSFVVDSHSGNTFWVESNGETQRLIKKNAKGQKQTLLSAEQFIGDIRLSNDNQRLYFATIQTSDSNKKCTLNHVLSLNSTEGSKPVANKPCDDNQLHSALEISPTTLLFVRNNMSSSELWLEDLELKQQQMIYQTSLPILSVEYQDGFVFVLHPEQLIKAQLIQQQFTQVFEPIKFSFVATSFSTNREFTVVAGSNGIYWYRQQQLVAESVMPTQQKITDIAFTGENQLSVLSQNQDIQIERFKLNGDRIGAIGSSQFVESNGQFTPSNSISVISNRSGKNTLWLQTENDQSAILEEATEIDDYLWDHATSTVWFISEQQLWRAQQYSRPQTVALQGKPMTLFNIVNGQLLLQTELDGKTKLSLFSDTSASTKYLYSGALAWAQLTENMQVISATSSGQLAWLNDGQLQGIPQLAAHKLHWRFYLRQRDGSAQALYFQDKLGQLWRWNLNNSEAKQIGRIVPNSLLVTDVSELTQSYLAVKPGEKKTTLSQLTFQ